MDHCVIPLGDNIIMLSPRGITQWSVNVEELQNLLLTLRLFVNSTL